MSVTLAVGADHSLVPHPRAGIDAVAKPFHDIRPGAGDHFGVLRGQVSLGHNQVHLRQFHRVVPGQDNSLRFGLVAGLQTLLLSRDAVFTVIDAPASEDCESVLHSCLSFYGHELKTVKQQWRRSAE